jgi:hypothetical protein
MDRAILMAQLAALNVQLALQVPGSQAQETIEAQIMMLQNELSPNPVVDPIFGPHPWNAGPHGGQPHGGR